MFITTPGLTIVSFAHPSICIQQCFVFCPHQCVTPLVPCCIIHLSFVLFSFLLNFYRAACLSLAHAAGWSPAPGHCYLPEPPSLVALHLAVSPPFPPPFLAPLCSALIPLCDICALLCTLLHLSPFSPSRLPVQSRDVKTLMPGIQNRSIRRDTSPTHID